MVIFRHKVFIKEHALVLQLLSFCLLLSFSAAGFAQGISEDFAKGTLNNSWTAYGGQWGIENGEAIVPNGAGYKALTTKQFTDFSYTVRLKANSGNAIGVLFRVTDPNVGTVNLRGYFAFIQPGINNIGLSRLNYDWTALKGQATELEYDQWYDLRVDAFGASIKVYLDGVLKISVEDDTFASGSIGVINRESEARVARLSLAPSIEGIYTLSGDDYAGVYSGTAEIRRENDAYKLTKLQDYTELASQGLNVSSVIEGTAQSHPDGSITMAYNLDLVGYIKQADGSIREEDFSAHSPIAVTETLLPTGNSNEYSGLYSAIYQGVRYSFPEVWQKTGARPAQALWMNQRLEIPTSDTATAFSLGLTTALAPEYQEAEFHALPQIAPYTHRQEFQDRIHYWVFDPTDYDYYQQNPNRVRVIQKVIDPISLAEARLRNSAYRYNLTAKAAVFDMQVPEWQINELGFAAQWDEGEGRYRHDGDALLWTGIYVAAMSQKYLATRDPSALDKLLKSLNAVINAVDIVRNNPNDSLSDTFARTIMLDRGRANSDAEWRRGTMQYADFSQVEYKRGGNNDMSKGIMIAAFWGTKALRTLSTTEYAAVANRYGDIRTRMIEALVALRQQHRTLFVPNCGLSQLGEANKWPRSMQLNLVLYNLVLDQPNYQHILDYNKDIKECYNQIRTYSVKTEWNFSNIAGVISDWSGNHLGIWSLYLNYQAFVDATGEQSDEANDYREFFENADEQMLAHRMGLFKLVSGTLRYQPNHSYWIEQALWRLREVPTIRGHYEIDWTINPKHTASPYPELIWKYTRAEAADRVQSLRAYPLFESAASNYYWKDNPFNQYKGPVRTGLSGIDYLMAYWFARYHGVITDAQ